MSEQFPYGLAAFPAVNEDLREVVNGSTKAACKRYVAPYRCLHCESDVDDSRCPATEDGEHVAICWYAKPGSPGAQAAQNICLDQCPIAFECGEWALATNERLGIWGGLTPTQRWEELKRRGITPTHGRSYYGSACRVMDNHLPRLRRPKKVQP